MADLTTDRDQVNNAFYDDLGDRWYHAKDDPVALLRAEGRKRAEWLKVRFETYRKAQKTSGSHDPKAFQVLDVGCGAGLLSNPMSEWGLEVTGLDASAESLRIAQKFDTTGRVKYVPGDAYALPFADRSFDAVTAMDFLEHVSEPERVLDEVARVLRPGGLFFYHTFNQNRFSQLIVIKGVEWFVKNTPKDLHVYHLFIAPKRLEGWLTSRGFVIEEVRGLRPSFSQKAFWKMLWTGSVDEDFQFKWTKSKLISYTGVAVLKAQP